MKHKDSGGDTMTADKLTKLSELEELKEKYKDYKKNDELFTSLLELLQGDD